MYVDLNDARASGTPNLKQVLHLCLASSVRTQTDTVKKNSTLTDFSAAWNFGPVLVFSRLCSRLTATKTFTGGVLVVLLVNYVRNNIFIADFLLLFNHYLINKAKGWENPLILPG